MSRTSPRRTQGLVRVTRLACFAVAAGCTAALALYFLAYSKCDPTTCTDHRATVAIVLGTPLVLFGVAGIRLVGWEDRHG
jgi:hypothetical protein